jgi:hypothetical protein
MSKTARSVKSTDRVTVYRDGQNREVAVETCEACEACNGKGCDGCKGLGFLRITEDELS